MGIPTRIVSTKTGDPSSGKIDDHLWGEHKAPTPYNFKGIEFNPAYFGTETVKCGDRILPLQKSLSLKNSNANCCHVLYVLKIYINFPSQIYGLLIVKIRNNHVVNFIC